MSNVAEAVDFRVGMAEWLGTLKTFYNKDIRALPENLLSTSPGGVAKTPGAMTGEVVGMLLEEGVRHQIELSVLECFSLVNGRPSHDQIQHAFIFWRTPDEIQTAL